MNLWGVQQPQGTQYPLFKFENFVLCVKKGPLICKDIRQQVDEYCPFLRPNCRPRLL